MEIRPFIKKIIMPLKRKPTKMSLSDYRTYRCKLCGEFFEPKYLGKGVLSAYTQLKRHLLLVHGKKSVKKKYAKKYSSFNMFPNR